MKSSLALVGMLAGSLGALPAGEDLGFRGWTVDGPAVLAETREGAVLIRYESPQFEKIVLRPPVPVALPEGTTRFRYWCARLGGDFDARVIVRDAAGRECTVPTLNSRPEFPAIRYASMKEWSVWHQVETVHLTPSGRIEDRILPEFQDMARRLEWQQPLALAGIEILPARGKRGNEAFGEEEQVRAGRGALWLAEPAMGSADGLRARFNWYLNGRWRWGWDTRPCLFPDDLTRMKGGMRYAVEIRKGYQGPVVWRTTGERNVDRADAPALLAARIELPVVPAGRYFVECKSWRPDGILERVETMEWFVIAGERNGTSTETTPYTWETGRPHHVYENSTTDAEIRLAVEPGAWPGGETPAACVVRVVDWQGRLLGESVHVPGGEVTVACTGLKEGTDYAATAEFRDGGKVLDRTTLHFGVASAPRIDGGTVPPVPGRDEMLFSRRALPIAELYGSVLGSATGQAASEADLQETDRWLESLPGLGFGTGSVMFGWGEGEPLPGVFRWEGIAPRLDLAQRLGIRMFLTPALWGDPLEWPRWVEFQPMLDQFGGVLTPGHSGVPQPAATDPVRREYARHWLEAVARRFRDHPNVVGYRTKPVNLAAENHPQVTRADLSPVVQRSYGEWLAAGGKAPAELSPVFFLPGQNPTRTGPDLSIGWRQFMDFRVHTYVESVRGLIDAVRAVDDKRQIHIYRSSTPTAFEAAIPLLAGGAEFHDEGGPFYFQRAMESMCLQAGIPYTNEGHQFTPPSRALVDAGFFYGSIYDRGWCWLYRWNSRRQEDKRFATLPGVLEFVRDSQPAMREWAGAAGAPPQVLVFGSRADSLLDGARTGFYSDITGVETFAGLFAYHQVPAHFADEYTEWVDLSRFRCVLAAGEIMAARAVERLADFAQKGGKLVLVGNAGRLCAEAPAERDVLRGRLKGLANVRELPEPGVKAPPPGEAFRAWGAFPGPELGSVLEWAGVERTVRVETEGFECVRKQSDDGNRVYVAVFRRFPGEYENVWYDAEVEQKWGRRSARVVVGGMAGGTWRIEKIHRTSGAAGTASAGGGTVAFETEPALVSELQIYRLTREL